MGQVCLRLRPRLADDSWKILIITHKERNKHTNLNKSDITAETPQPQTEKRRLSLNPILRLGWRTWALRIEPQIHLKSLQKPIKIAFIFAEREIHIAEQRERGSRWRSMETVIIAMQCIPSKTSTGFEVGESRGKGLGRGDATLKIRVTIPRPREGFLGPGDRIRVEPGQLSFVCTLSVAQWACTPPLHTTPLHSRCSISSSSLLAAFPFPGKRVPVPFHSAHSADKLHKNFIAPAPPSTPGRRERSCGWSH